jgi:hypothetical protein
MVAALRWRRRRQCFDAAADVVETASGQPDERVVLCQCGVASTRQQSVSRRRQQHQERLK